MTSLVFGMTRIEYASAIAGEIDVNVLSMHGHEIVGTEEEPGAPFTFVIDKAPRRRRAAKRGGGQ